MLPGFFGAQSLVKEKLGPPWGSEEEKLGCREFRRGGQNYFGVSERQ